MSSKDLPERKRRRRCELSTRLGGWGKYKKLKGQTREAVLTKDEKGRAGRWEVKRGPPSGQVRSAVALSPLGAPRAGGSQD